MKLRILAQYYENYAAHNEDWDGEREGWKPKGGIEFVTELTDAQDYFSESDLIEIAKIALAKESNKVAKYEFLDMDRVFQDPEDITKLFNESFEEWRVASGFNDKFERIDPEHLEIISDDERRGDWRWDDGMDDNDDNKYAYGGNVSNDTINHEGKDIYVLKVPLGQKRDWAEVIRDFFNDHDGKVNKKVWDNTISVLNKKEPFKGLAKGWKEYKELVEIEVDGANYVNPFHFADGGEADSPEIQAINKELQDFDPENLDPYEEMIYRDMMNKGNPKVSTLQIIINQVEGDYSQLSDELAKIAERQDEAYSRLGENDVEEEVMARGGNVKKRTKFSDKVEAIATFLKGKKVPPKYQKDYGKRYGKDDAEQAGRRIAGAMLKKEMEKYEDGGQIQQFIKDYAYNSGMETSTSIQLSHIGSDDIAPGLKADLAKEYKKYGEDKEEARKKIEDAGYDYQRIYRQLYMNNFEYDRIGDINSFKKT